MSKPKIFLSIPTYLPGYRGGGPIQSVKNIVYALSDEFDFYIFTANHDFGVKKEYDTVKTNEWNNCFGAKIFYSSDVNKVQNLRNILKNESFSLVFLNSFFSIDTIRVLLISHHLKLKTPTILMPRGELSEGALNIKKLKKTIYIKLAKKVDFLRNIHYLTTAQDEFEQTKQILNANNVSLVSNIPNTEKKITLNTKESNKLKVVFLSRISVKKNLDYALKTLKNCHNNIEFDIYGTMEDKSYWAKCEKVIETLPSNITVSYKGELVNELVIKTLADYDVFYFPTKSENYGHVISEALQASVPVLLSNKTPWLDLEEKKQGWVFDLSNSVAFTKKLEDLTKLGKEEYNHFKKHIYETFEVESTVDKVASEYKKILKELIVHEK